MIKLNFGCGTNRLDGWINYDAEVDIAEPLPFPAGTADFMFAEHCVEHVKYYAAIGFFKECRRVLKPSGVVRITVPSIEMIMACDDQEYFEFTTKWQTLGANVRGAMNAILYAHGHQTAWTRSLLVATLFYAGFDNSECCEPGESEHIELCGVEGHQKVIGERFNRIESLVVEAW